MANRSKASNLRTGVVIGMLIIAAVVLANFLALAWHHPTVVSPPERPPSPAASTPAGTSTTAPPVTGARGTSNEGLMVAAILTSALLVAAILVTVTMILKSKPEEDERLAELERTTAELPGYKKKLKELEVALDALRRDTRDTDTSNKEEVDSRVGDLERELQEVKNDRRRTKELKELLERLTELTSGGRSTPPAGPPDAARPATATARSPASPGSAPP